MTRTTIPKATRARVFSLAGGCCELCGTKLAQRWECDHATPHFYVQGHDVENLQALCVECHALKTKGDVKSIAKTKRIIRKREGTWRPNRKRIQSPGFNKTLRKKFSGEVQKR